MTNILFITGGGSQVLATGATTNSIIGSGGGVATATESQAQTTWRDVGKFSNLYMRVSANATTAGNTTVKYRVGAVNGNQNLSITHGTTGEFTDITNSDTAAVADKINWQIINTTGGNFTWEQIAVQFAPNLTGNTINKLTSNSAFTISAGNQNYFFPFAGTITSSIEANAQFKVKSTFTAQNLYVFISSNNGSISIQSRKGGATGNLSILASLSSTGAFEDTTHSDSLVSGNLYNTWSSFGKSSPSITINNISIDLLSNLGRTHYIAGNPSPATIATSITNYCATADRPSYSTTEANKQTAFLGCSMSNLESFVSANGITATSTIKFRKGAANGNQNISYTTGLTGYLEDTTNSDKVLVGNEIDYQIITGGTGTTISIASLGVLSNYNVGYNDPIWFGMTI